MSKVMKLIFSISLVLGLLNNDVFSVNANDVESTSRIEETTENILEDEETEDSVNVAKEVTKLEETEDGVNDTTEVTESEETVEDIIDRETRSGETARMYTTDGSTSVVAGTTVNIALEYYAGSYGSTRDTRFGISDSPASTYIESVSLLKVTDENGNAVSNTVVENNPGSHTVKSIDVGEKIVVVYAVTIKNKEDLPLAAASVQLSCYMSFSYQSTGASKYLSLGLVDGEHKLEVEKTTSDPYAVARPGELVRYVIRVKNTGNLPLTNVFVHDLFYDPNFSQVILDDVYDEGGNIFTNGVTKIDNLDNTDAADKYVKIDSLAVGQQLFIHYDAYIEMLDGIDANYDVVKNKYLVSCDELDDKEDFVTTPLIVHRLDAEKYVTAGPLYSTVYPDSVVNYSIKVKNTGNSTLNNIVVTDAFDDVNFASSSFLNVQDSNGTAISAGVTVSGNTVTINSLAKGKEYIVNYSGTIKSIDDLDVSRTKVFNSATVSSDETAEKYVNANVDLAAEKLSIEKTASATSVEPGDIIEYKVKVKNEGNTVIYIGVVDLFDDVNIASYSYVKTTDSSGANITDNTSHSVGFGGACYVSVRVPTNPGEFVIIHFTAHIKDIDDIDTSKTEVVNTARADNLLNGHSMGVTSTVSVDLAAPSLTVKKTADKTFAEPGDVIEYTIDVKNTGNADLTNINVEDVFDDVNFSGASFVSVEDAIGNVMVSGYTVTGTNVVIDELEPGHNVLVKYSATVHTMTNINATRSSLVNEVDVSSDQTDTVSDTLSVPLHITDLLVHKSTTQDVAKANDQIPYTVKLKNLGNVAITNIIVDDPFDDVNFASSSFIVVTDESGQNVNNGISVSGNVVTIANLAPGEEMNVQYTGIVKAQQNLVLSRTNIVNTVKVKSDSTPEVTGTVTVPLYAPAMTLVKDIVDPSVIKVSPSDVVEYKVVLTNTGNVDLNNVVVDDMLDDVNFESGSGELVSVIDGNGTDITNTVVQIGNKVSLDSISPGENIVVTYKVNVKDISNIDASKTSVVNIASAHSDEIEEVTATKAMPLEVHRITVDKYLTDSTVTDVRPAETVYYTVKVENTGNKVLNSVLVSDPFNDPNFASAQFIDVKDSDGNAYNTGVANSGTNVTISTLAVGQVLYVNYSAVVKGAEDINNTLAVINNVATVVSNETDSITDEVDVVLNAPNIEIDKSLKDSTITEAEPDDVIAYKVRVTNTGNIPLTNVVVNDLFDDVNFENPQVVNVEDSIGNVIHTGFSRNGTSVTIEELDVGNTLFVNYTVEIKSVELIDDTKMSVVNTVGVTSDQTALVTDSVTLPLNAPDMEVDKTSTKATASLEEVIPYTVTVKNTGNIVLNNVVINDPFSDVDFASGTASFVNVTDSSGAVVSNGVSNNGTVITISSLAVGETVYVNYTVQIIDEDNYSGTKSSVTNTVTVGSDETVDVTDSLELPLDVYGITMTKSTKALEASPSAMIQYVIKVENTGHSKLTNVVVNDPFDDVNFASYSFAFASDVNLNGLTNGISNNGTVVTIDELNKGEVVYITYNAVVKNVDSLDNSKTKLVNTATVKSDQTPEITDRLELPLVSYRVEIDKSVNVLSVKAGDFVGYTIAVKNTGNMDLTNITVDDAFLDNNFDKVSAKFTGVVDSGGNVVTSGLTAIGTRVILDNLAVGDTVYVSYIVKIKDASSIDFSKKHVVNEASVITDQTKKLTDSASVSLIKPSLTIEKSTSTASASKGNVVNYTVKVMNVGGASTTNVIVSDLFDDVNFDTSSAKVESVEYITRYRSNYVINGTDVKLKNFGAGDIVIIEYSVKVKDSLANEKATHVINVASVLSDDVEKISSNEVKVPLTSLPSTGGQSYFMLVALLLLVLLVLKNFVKSNK